VCALSRGKPHNVRRVVCKSMRMHDAAILRAVDVQPRDNGRYEIQSSPRAFSCTLGAFVYSLLIEQTYNRPKSGAFVCTTRPEGHVLACAQSHHSSLAFVHENHHTTPKAMVCEPGPNIHTYVGNAHMSLSVPISNIQGFHCHGTFFI
jgi:hypothetical protein